MKKEQISDIFDELDKKNTSDSRIINNNEQIWVDKLNDGTFAVFRVKKLKSPLPKKWEFEETFHFKNKEDLERYLESI